MLSQRENDIFPITIAKKKPYFVDSQQKPFLWHGDTCWRLFWEYSFEEACTYLDDRAQRGFTVIQVHLIPRRFYQTNRKGQKPFLYEGDISSVNLEYFTYVEKILQYGRSLGLTFAISPMWLSSWEQDWHHYFHGQKARDYSSFVANRFKHLDNIIAWIHGGDDDCIALAEDVKQCATIYKYITPNVANTFHAGIGGGWEFYGEEDWFDFGMAYTYDKAECQRQLIEFRKSYSGKPVLLGETHYEGNEGIGSEIIRYYAYQSLLLGGCGQTYGHKDIWMGTMFWELALCSTASHHMEELKAIWEQLDWANMQPDLDCNELLTLRSKMPDADNSPLAALLHQDQSQLIAYVPDYRWFKPKQSVKKGIWIDPITGKKRPLKWVGPNQDCLQVPGKNAAGYQDWLLQLYYSKE